MRYSILFVLVFAAAEVGCGAKLPSVKPFKLEIQQGNLVTSKMLLQLRPGMTRSQVRYIMGTPLIVDSFRDNRWDYFYELRKQGVVVEKRRVILDFDKDSLVSVRGDVAPSADQAAQEAPKTEAVKPQLVEPKQSSWLDKLMFWKSDEDKPSTPAPAEAKNAVPAAASVASPVTNATLVEEKSVDVKDKAIPEPVTNPRESAADVAQPTKQALAEPIAATQMAVESTSTLTKQTTSEQDASASANVAESTQVQVTDSDALILKQVQQSVDLWLDALKRKDVAAYFAAYAPEFVSEDKLSKKNWQAQRKRQILAAKGEVAVEIEGLNLHFKNKLAIATFKQKMTMQNHTEEVIKTLSMRFNQSRGLWLITQENTEPLKPVIPKTDTHQSKAPAPEENSERLEDLIEKIGF